MEGLASRLQDVDQCWDDVVADLVWMGVVCAVGECVNGSAFYVRVGVVVEGLDESGDGFGVADFSEDFDGLLTDLGLGVVEEDKELWNCVFTEFFQCELCVELYEIVGVVAEYLDEVGDGGCVLDFAQCCDDGDFDVGICGLRKHVGQMGCGMLSDFAQCVDGGLLKCMVGVEEESG